MSINESILNPFKEKEEETSINKVHIRLQQRNGRKSWTIVEGLNEKLDLEMIAKHWRRTFSCSATVINEDDTKIIQLSGDQRESVKLFLISEEINKANDVIMHGY